MQSEHTEALNASKQSEQAELTAYGKHAKEITHSKDAKIAKMKCLPYARDSVNVGRGRGRIMTDFKATESTDSTCRHARLARRVCFLGHVEGYDNTWTLWFTSVEFLAFYPPPPFKSRWAL